VLVGFRNHAFEYVITTEVKRMRVEFHKRRFSSPNHRFVVTGLVSLALWPATGTVVGQNQAPAIKAAPGKAAPQVQNPIDSPYSVATPSLKIQYETKRNDDTGTVKIVVPGAVLSPADATVKIEWTKPALLPPVCVSVVFTVTYNKQKGDFLIAGPVRFVENNFVISADQLQDFADRLLAKIATKLPPGFDPSMTVVTISDPIEISVTPLTSTQCDALDALAIQAKRDQDEAAARHPDQKTAKAKKDAAAKSKAAAAKAAAPEKRKGEKTSNTLQIILESPFGDG
jgi:hypothetical protein